MSGQVPEPHAGASEIVGAALRLLGGDAVPATELARQLAETGLDLGDDALDTVFWALQGDPRFRRLHGGSWISSTAMLFGTTWSSRIPAVPPDDECLPVEPDLSLVVWWALEEPIPLVGAAGALESAERDDGSEGVGGPPGWLTPYAGAVLLVQVTDEGVILHHTDDAPVPSAAQTTAVHEAFELIASHDTLAGDLVAEPVHFVTAMLDDVLAEAIVADRDAFLGEAIPPVDDLLGAAGLERRDHIVGVQGTDWRAHERWAWRRRMAFLYELDDDEVESLEILELLVSRAAAGDPEPLGPPDAEDQSALLAAMCLADERLAEAFDATQETLDTPPEVLAAFARLVLEHVDDEVAAGVRWLLGRALDQLGDALGAAAELELAVAADPEFTPACLALAGFRSDAGDAAGALALLRDLDPGDDDRLLLEVEPYAMHRPRPTAGRNDPCPCGSGRKYKVCHLGREALPLVERGPWLYAKARRYLEGSPFVALVEELAMTIAEDSDQLDVASDLLDSALVADLALCEGGAFAAFLAARDAILPDDEALLAASWAFVSRSLFEIEHIAPGALTLRDLRSGDQVVVTNVEGSDVTRPGGLVLGRPLPVNDTWRAFSGFVPLPDSVRDAMLAALDEGDPFVIASLVGQVFAPPELRNADGEELVLHELRFRVADTGRAARALRESDLVDLGDGSWSLVRDADAQSDTVMVSFDLDGDELLAFANSDTRAEVARALVAELLPDAVLVDHGRRSLAEVLEARADDDDRREPQPDDPSHAAILDEYVRSRELQWLDESIPALDGMTPRAAVVDPVMRPELERLLHRFEDAPLGPGGFDAARLRVLLGLSPPA